MHLFDLLAFVIAGLTYWFWPKGIPERKMYSFATGFSCWVHLHVWFFMFISVIWSYAYFTGRDALHERAVAAHFPHYYATYPK